MILLNISSGLSNAHKYYIVADFGAAMDDGDSVSLILMSILR